MNMLTTTEIKMTSLDFLNNYINPAREEAGQSPHARYATFLEKVEDEIDDLPMSEKVTPIGGGKRMTVYLLNHDQLMLIGMRESKAVRKSVLVKLKGLLNQRPVMPAWFESLSPMAKIAIEDLDRQRIEAIETKAEIGHRREATAMNTASQAVKKANKLEIELDKSKEYCTIKRMEMLCHGQKFKWRELKSASTQLELPPIDVFDSNYGTVKSYHRDAWIEAYGLEF